MATDVLLMSVLSVTRIQARGGVVFVPFMRASLRAALAAKGAEGFQEGRLLRDKGRVFWTVTLWDDLEALERYRGQAAHAAAMRDTQRFAETFAFAHVPWQGDLPSWPEAGSILAEEGKVRGTDAEGRPVPAEALPGPRATGTLRDIPLKP